VQPLKVRPENLLDWSAMAWEEAIVAG